jgi:hypothetical protein
LTKWPKGCLDTVKGKPNWMLLGDSHANHLWFGLSQARPDVNLMQATVSTCRMTLTPADDATPQCRRLNAILYRDILTKRPPDRVILAGLWHKGDETAVAETLAWFKVRHIPVVVIGPAPTYEQSVPRLLALAEHLHQPDLPARRRYYSADKVEPLIAGAAASEGVPYLSILDAVCPAGPDGVRVCRTRTPDGEPMEWDQAHLSRGGSLWVGAHLMALPAAR